MALSTSRTLITKTGISTTQVFDMGGINIPGGDFNLGSAIKLGNASGIITATSFSGVFTGVNTAFGNSSVNTTGIITATRIVSTIGTFTGDTAISGSLQIADTIQHEGDVNTKIRFPSNDTISFETNGSEKARVITDGNIGIGTTLPNVSGFNADAKVLTLSGSKRGIIELRGDVPAADTIGAIRFFSANNNKAEIKSVTDGSFNSNFVFTSNGSERVTLDEHLTISNGNLVIGTSGHGIDFSVTGNGSGSMSNELLDDYEEGSWTASISGGNFITTNAAYYTKIGRMVYWMLHCVPTFAYNDTNTYQIYGLPYTSANVSYNYGWSANIVYTSSANSTVIENMRPLVEKGNTYIYFHRVGQGSSSRVDNVLIRTTMLNQEFLLGGQYMAAT